MMYQDDIAKAISKINPLALTGYLRNTGWKQLKIKRTDMQIFQLIKGNDDLFQVTIPLDSHLIDYKSAMYYAIEQVAFASHQTIEQLIFFLVNPISDVLKIRLDRKDVEMGNISINDAINLYENTKKLITSAAQDVLTPKLNHKGRVNDTVYEMVDKCRFGQTEVGSYVISIICPFMDENGNKELSLFSTEETCAESFTRKVTNKIMTNISTIKTSIDNGDYRSLVDGNRDDVISSNFFEALSGMNLDKESTNVEFIAQWSPSVKQNRCDVSRITISNNYYQPMMEIVSRIKDDTVANDTIVGRVKSLTASPDASRRNSGEVSITYLDNNDKAKNIKVNLDADDYNSALEAHQNGRYVQISGNILKGKMEKCNSFSVID